MAVALVTTRRAVTTALSGFVHAQQQATAHPDPADALAQILHRLDAIEDRLAG